MSELTKEMEKLLLALNSSVSCPSCGLQGKPRKCPKCNRNACDKCIAIDNSDCMFCGPHGEIAKECFWGNRKPVSQEKPRK